MGSNHDNILSELDNSRLVHAIWSSLGYLHIRGSCDAKDKNQMPLLP